MGLVFISLLQLISSGWRAGGIKETFKAIKHTLALRKTEAGILKLEDECWIPMTDGSCWSVL